MATALKQPREIVNVPQIQPESQYWGKTGICPFAFGRKACEGARDKGAFIKYCSNPQFYFSSDALCGDAKLFELTNPEAEAQR